MSLAVGTGKYGLKVGSPSLKSVGALAFGPDGILFVADNASASIFAIDVGEGGVQAQAAPLNIDNLDSRVAAYLGCSRADVLIRDMAVHPVSQSVYLSVTRGAGLAAIPVLLKIAADRTISEVAVDKAPFSRTSVEKAPADDDKRTEVRVVQGDREGEVMTMRTGGTLRLSRDPLRTVTVTDMVYADGLLLVAGASNEEFSSALRRIPFPFTADTKINSLEIYHVSHQKYETASPIRNLVTYQGNTSVLASYTCTPVVHFSLKDLEPGMQAKGRTVAELGAGNTPLDMVSFSRGGDEYLLVSNSRHPLMKIACSDIDKQEALTQPKEPVGVPRATLPQKGVSKMANAGNSQMLMLQLDDSGSINLRSYAVASL